MHKRLREERQDLSHRQLPPVDIQSLTTEQHLAYNIVCSHHMSTLCGELPEPLHMIICGTAGTGKSFLISALAHLLKDSCLLTGTTGMAAFNICGITLHSALQLPVRENNKQPLQGQPLARLQMRLANKQYLIIDEMSMLGQRMFAWVDKRLRQGTGQLDKPLGNFSVILIGDFAQLSPVGDMPLYSPTPSSDLGCHGYAMYRLFTTVVTLTQVLRQAGATDAGVAFRTLLLCLRNGTVTNDDWKLLLSRSPQQATNFHAFSDAVRLFYGKASVAHYNILSLHKLGMPVATINAVHSSAPPDAAQSDEAGGLEPIVFLANGAKAMLTANLWPEVGLRM